MLPDADEFPEGNWAINLMDDCQELHYQVVLCVDDVKVAFHGDAWCLFGFCLFASDRVFSKCS